MKKSISLVEGGSGANFLIGELITYFKKEKINYIIVGANHIILENHPKPNSLDVWLRNHESVAHSYKNTCQDKLKKDYLIITKQNKKVNYIKNNMTKEEINKIYQTPIDSTRNVAKQISIENLKKIILEFELNPEEFNHDDVKNNYKIFKEELELKLNIL